MKLARLLMATLVSGVLAGCMVGPNYHRPNIQTPTVYRDLSENPQLQAQTASYADLPWWQVFKQSAADWMAAACVAVSWRCR